MDNQQLIIDNDDFCDVIFRIEKSFDIRFDDDELYRGITFGDLCKSIDSKMNRLDSGGCSSQQAFYKLKEALITLNISDKDSIKPHTPLADILGKNRKKSAHKLKSHLGIKVFMFETPGYIALPLIVVCIISFITMFFKWEFAWGFGISIAILYIASKLTTNLSFKTVEELINHLVIYNYKNVRRNADTYNKNEIETVTKFLFLDICGVEENELSPKTIIL